MPRYVLPVLILAVVVVAVLLTWWTLGRPGPARENTVAEQDVAAFRRLDLSGAADVTLRQGSTSHISIDAPRGAGVSAQVEDDTLIITTRDTRRWWQSLIGGARSTRTPKITITFRELGEIEMSGAVNVTAVGLDTPQLRVSASGGTNLRIDGLRTTSLHVEADGALKARLAGTATEQHISISGAGQYNAGDLVSQTASVEVSGVGDVVLRVEKSLDASISGAGSIDYYGNPQVRKSVSGVGTIRQREAGDMPRHGPRVAATTTPQCERPVLA